MSAFTRLPAAVETVLVPDKLGPTQIARAVECRLAGVLPSSLSSDERLPPDPRAVLGTILHRLVQDARQGRVASGGGDLRKALAEHLQKLIAAREAELLKGVLAHFVPLRATVTFAEFLDRTTRALARAQQVYRPESPRADGGVSAASAVLDGVEVKLESDKLKLTGSLDACHEGTDEIVIRDLKTGNVRDAYGVAPHVSLQLGLYALLAQELRPGKRIRLFVDHASSDELPWGDKQETAVRETLASVRSDLKPGRADAMALATAGSACRWCEARHRCPAYREQAPKWWSSSALDFVPPSDVAGVLDGKPVSTNDVAAIRLRDLSGRHVSIVGITTRHGAIDELEPKQTLWLFAVAPRGSNRDADARYSHPTNFREAALARGERPAFNAALFVATGGGALK